MKQPIPLATLHLMDECYMHWTGHALETPASVETSRYRWLHEKAPFGLMAHGVGHDPCFIYANRAAQARFGYSLEEFLRLPSRLSALPGDRGARDVFLRALRNQGIVRGYSGVRVARDGRTFRIHDCVVWELQDTFGKRIGQAALYCFSDSMEHKTAS